MPSCLMRYSILYELNTLDACWIAVNCGVIVVDAGRSRFTCLGRDAYIHDHCLRYRHNYVLFYQLLNSNLFTHRMISFKREVSSENYGPWVYLHHINLPTLIYFLCFYFTLHLIIKIPKILSYQISLSPVAVKGLTTPLSRWVQVFVCLCRCNCWRLVCSSYWIDTLVLN